jgi:hypothetical protein
LVRQLSLCQKRERQSCIRPSNKEIHMSRHLVATLTRVVAVLLLLVMALAPQLSAKRFQTGPPSYTVGQAPFFVTTADLRGIGRQDIIAANSNLNGGGGASTTISVLLSNGDGTYQPAVPYTVGNNPIAIAAGKFTTGGHVDLAVANPGSNTISILKGNGDGTFQPQTTINVGPNPAGVFAADLNQDGKLDLVVTNSDLFGLDNCASSSVMILLGNGNGTFGAPTTVQTGSCPLDVGIASLRKNGILDLVVVNSGGLNSTTTGNVSVLAGNGDGSFQPAAPYSVGTRPDFVAIADFNGDGSLDLAVTNNGASGANGGIVLLPGNGDGTFQPATFVVAVPMHGLLTGDFNNDGKADLASVDTGSNSLLVLLGNGDGTFQGKSMFLPSGQFGLAAADLNGDGKLDLAVPVDLSPNPGAVAVLLGNGNGTFQRAINDFFFLGGNASPQTIATADLNNDGKPDLFFGSVNFTTNSSGAKALLGNGDGTFTPMPTLGLGPNRNSTGVATGSFKNNGKQDFVVSQNLQSGTGLLRYLAGNGDGTFQPSANTPLSFNPFQIAAADFNKDGNLDVVMGDCSKLAVFFGNGSGAFALSNQYSNGVNCDSGQVAVGDLNGDGYPDLVVTDIDNSGHLNAYVLLNNGLGSPGTFAGAVAYSVGPAPANFAGLGVALGHFKESTGAGHLDIAASDPANNTVTILTNNGDGTFAVGNSYAVGTNPVYIAAGNFDGTGHVSLAVANCTNCNTSGAGSTISVLYGNGDGTFALDPTSYVAGFGSLAIAVGDYNGDGAPDLAVANSNDGTVTILLNTGGTFMNLASSLNPAFYGQSVKFTASVAPSLPAATVPTGTVTFKDGSTTLGSGALTSGTATFTTITPLTAGSHPITASYSGDSNFAPRVSAPLPQTVNPASTAIAITNSSINPSTTAQAVTFTATLTSPTASVAGVAGETVTFMDGVTSLGTGTLNASGQATSAPQTLSTTGIHPITVVYAGDANFSSNTSPAFSQTVNSTGATLTTTAITNTTVSRPTPGQPAGTLQLEQTVSFTVQVSTASGVPSGNVQLVDNGTPLGGTMALPLSGSTQVLNFGPFLLSMGSHSITAEYFGDSTFQSSASVATQLRHVPRPR